MKILFVMDSLGTGGAERSTSHHWYFLRARGVEISIIALRHRREGIEQEILKAGFDVHFVRSGSFVGQARELAALVKSLKPDIVHSILFKSNLRVRLARMFLRFRHVESLVNSSYDKVRLKDPNVSAVVLRFYKVIDRITSRWVDRWVAITGSVKDHYVQMIGLSPEKISVVYRGRDENIHLASRDRLRREYCEELRIDPRAVIVINIGRQEFQKGHEVLLRAIAEAERVVELPMAYLFLGREGNMTSRIRQLERELTIHSPLRWLGHRPDAEKLLAVSDIFVFPSLYEGLGGVLIEAQAARLPLVCSNLPVFDEIIVKDKTALTFPAGNHVALAEVLSRLVTDKEVRERMGQHGLDNFRKRFTLDEINIRMNEFYRSLLS